MNEPPIELHIHTCIMIKELMDALVQALCCCTCHIEKDYCQMKILVGIRLPRPPRKKNWACDGKYLVDV